MAALSSAGGRHGAEDHEAAPRVGPQGHSEGTGRRGARGLPGSSDGT